jgi:hypothetical protein
MISAVSRQGGSRVPLLSITPEMVTAWVLVIGVVIFETINVTVVVSDESGRRSLLDRRSFQVIKPGTPASGGGRVLRTPCLPQNIFTIVSSQLGVATAVERRQPKIIVFLAEFRSGRLLGRTIAVGPGIRRG